MLFALVFMSLQIVANAQSSQIDPNEFYKFPFSVGIQVQYLSPLKDYEVEVNSAIDAAAIVRYPLPFFPKLQPLLRTGIMSFDFTDENVLNPDQWDHTHIYGAIGASYIHKFAKAFEAGGELTFGFSQGIFPDLNPDENVVSLSPTFIFSAGVRASLNPSYNININFHPSLKGIFSFTAMKKFNSLLFGIGATINYRLGSDPDSDQSIIRSIRFGEAQIPPLYAALQSYYVNNAIGSVTLTNSEKYSIYDVEVSFFQPDFMDNPTSIATIPELTPEETREVDLFATFNQKVFTIEGGTPLTGELKTVYISRNKTVEQSLTVDYFLYDKTSLVWDDDRKVAAYITPKDSALRNYTSTIRQYTKNDVNPGLSANLQTGIQVFAGLTEMGVLYQVDPTSPFDAAQEDAQVVDAVNLPRTTLKLATGDCDDLTVLYNSLLEIAGIETGFITTPGHIYSAFNTGIPVKNYRLIHPDSGMIINFRTRDKPEKIDTPN